MKGREWQNFQRIIRKYNKGEITRDQAIQMLKSGYGLDDEAINTWLGDETYEQRFSDIDSVISMFDEYGEKAENFSVLATGQVFNADGSRRFTRAYVEVPRKNGKSTFSSAVMLYGLIADDEPAAQVYSAATKLDQAMMVFGESVRVCQNLPWLNEAQNWPDGTFWSLKEQLEYAIDEFAGREKLNVELA